MFSLTERGFDEAQAHLKSFPDLKSAGPQCLADDFENVPRETLISLNERCAREPRLSLRVFSSLDRNATCDLAGFELLSELRHLKLHYGVPSITNQGALQNLRKLQSAELEIIADFDTSFVGAWRNLEYLSIIRDNPNASNKPDFNNLGDLPKLSELYCLGYRKWQDGVKRSTSLRRLTLQQLTVDSWDFLPAQDLDVLRLNAVQGPAEFPKAQLAARSKKLDLVRMEKALGFDPKRLFSPLIRHENGYSTCIQADELSHVARAKMNGHGWAKEFANLSAVPKGIELDAEADMVVIYGSKSDVTRYKSTLLKALAEAYG
ncbi:MAG: hypothetical protein AAGF30_00200 [Pseudomonadota bacterium]